MNPDKDAELERILVWADCIVGAEANEEPGPLPEVVGAGQTPKVDAVSTQGMASHEGREGLRM